MTGISSLLYRLACTHRRWIVPNVETIAVVGSYGKTTTTAAIIGSDLGPGDVVLVKGRRLQRLERVSLLIAGVKVACSISSCRLTSGSCQDCPMLERGWEGYPKIA